MPEKDMNKPEIYKHQVGGDHYKRYKIQPFKFISENRLSFFSGVIIKYVCRINHNIIDSDDWGIGEYVTPDCDTYKGKGLTPQQQEIKDKLDVKNLQDLDKIIHYCKLKKQNILDDFNPRTKDKLTMKYNIKEVGNK